MPLPRVSVDSQHALALLARRAWSLKRSLDTRSEVSHAFTLPALLQIEGDTLTERAKAWIDHVRATETDVAAIQVDIDKTCFDLYGLNEADRAAVTGGFGPAEEESGEVAVTDTDSRRRR